MLKHLLPLLILSSVARADDYPQWLGPQRDGIYRERAIAATFPAGGPKILWRAPVGAGFAQPAIAAGKVILTDRILKEGVKNPANPFERVSIPGVERILCLSDADGKLLWKVEYDCPYSISYASGPRTTPAIDGDRVYTLGGQGDIYCIDINSGKTLWHKALGNPPIWGYSAAPLIHGDKLIVLSSGKPLLTAFDKLTGEIAWTALEAREPGYSPPMIHKINGQSQLVQWYPDALAGLDPQTGKVLWSVPYGPARMGLSVATPLPIGDDTFFVSTQYEGSAAIKGGSDNPRVLWHLANKGRAVSTLHTLHAQLIFHEGHVYGIHNMGELLCLDPTSGKIIWSDKRATLGEADPVKWTAAFITPLQSDLAKPASQFFIANEKGDLIIANLSTSGYTETARAHLLEPTNPDAQRRVLWSHPAYANQSVYWRNDNELIRASLSAEK